MKSKTTNQLKEKYEEKNQDLEDYLEDLLHSKPTNYWDHVQTVALLNHQINELLFKMIRVEIDQIAKSNALMAELFTNKLSRISRYFDMLTSSFSIMKDGMDLEQYPKFRTTLTPASDFQSAQYRNIEFPSTKLINLIDNQFRDISDRNSTYENALEQLYWHAAGMNYKTGKKSYTLTVFEEKYKDEFIRFAQFYSTNNVYSKFKELPKEAKENQELITAMRYFDYTVSIKWVMTHYSTTNHYLNIGRKTTEATGGSEWVKDMHPKYQKRIFFQTYG